MGLRGEVPERGRGEWDEVAAEVFVVVVVAVKNRNIVGIIIIKIIPGVFALIHRESIFLRVQDYRRRVLGSRR